MQVQQPVSALALDYPKPTTNPVGFLEIIRQERKELINTRLYAFFLDPVNNPLLADVFLSSLKSLIKKKTNTEINISDYTCSLEEVTRTRKRIDLVIYDQEADAAIIIENKLGHFLNNDLNEYYEHVNARQKIGIVLSLAGTRTSEISHGNFINLTHKQWVDEIKQKGLPVGLPPKLYIYLNDFFATIESLTVNFNMDEQTRFFFEHASKIRQAKECYDAAFNYVLSELQQVADHFKWKLNGNAPYMRYIWDADNAAEAYYLFDFDKILSEEKQIKITLELYSDTLVKVEKLNEALKDDVLLSRLNREGSQNNTYYHYANKKYIWDNTSHASLSEFVIQKLESDFHPLMKRILALI